MSNITQVTLRCERGEMRSRTSGGGGKRIQFEAVTGIALPGGELVALNHRDYKEAGVDGRKSYERSYPFSKVMAQRLLEFATTCFVQGSEGYDG